MKKQSPDLDQLIKNLPGYYPPGEIEKVRRAYAMAAEAHAGQTRASGEPYISHCLAVALILTEMNMTPDVIIAGLLHDTVEDTNVTLDQIEDVFSGSVRALVNGVTKLQILPRVSRSGEETAEQAWRRKREISNESFRKMIFAMVDDPRVVLIKLADRLHNIRTLNFTPPEKQKRIAQETIDIYAKLANRLGIWQIKWELEDLAFHYLHPEKYAEIAKMLNDAREVREDQIHNIITRIDHILQQAGIKAEISGRPKHIYSIYLKMQKKGKTFESLSDLRGVRLIVPDKPACYATLGIVHDHWRPMPGEFDDYIAAPKDNFYQSLHTAVLYDDGKPLEVQIRTEEMHQNAEFGIAAHWRYKESNAKVDARFERHILWLRSIVKDWRNEIQDSQEFMDSMKTDVFEDRVYVFTPKGDVIDLPAGSTPIDFAYHVHTDIGHRCRGARLDGKLTTLSTPLQTGQRVEILTSKQGGPSRDWLNPSLNMVKTQRARAKIAAWFKKQDRDSNLAQGRQILEREFHRLGLSEINLESLAHQLEYKNADDMFVAMGCDDLKMARIINLLSEQNPPELELVASTPKSETTSSQAVTVVGLRGLLTTMAKCCNPTPGDFIIGYVTRGRGATIHRQDCPNILRTKERERLVKVSWGESTKSYPVPIRIKAFDRQGLMSDISTLLNSEGINITDVNVRVGHERLNAYMASIRLVVEVRDLNQLSRMLNRIETLDNVLEVYRTRAG